MAFWWVNHKQTVAHEVGGSYLWSPVRNADGRRNQSYDNMTLAQPGDIVFSYANGRVGAAGYVMAAATPGGKPAEFGSTGAYWSQSGWYLPVEFVPANKPVVTQQVATLLAPYLPDIYSPIRENGMGNQGIYLAAISDTLGGLLLRLMGLHREEVEPFVSPMLADVPAEIAAIRNDQGISETQRSQLVQARVGQGLFRSQVLIKTAHCIVTGVRDRRLLRASHIKPWKASTNFERLDGSNGLTLTPHVDAMFDQGMLSFADDGTALVRNDVESEVVERLGLLGQPLLPRIFDDAQKNYLIHHRVSWEDVGFREVLL